MACNRFLMQYARSAAPHALFSDTYPDADPQMPRPLILSTADRNAQFSDHEVLKAMKPNANCDTGAERWVQELGEAFPSCSPLAHFTRAP